MRAPLPYLLSLMLLAAGAGAGNVKANTGRSGSGGQTGATGARGGVAPVPALNPSLQPLPAVSLAPKLELPPDPASAVPVDELPSAAGDGRLGEDGSSSVPSPDADAALPSYARALLEAGAPPALVGRLDAFLAARRSRRGRDAAGLAARMAAEAGLDRARTALLVLGASLHELGPALARDPARGLVAEFSGLFGFAPEDVASLAAAADLEPGPEKLRAIEEELARPAADEPGGGLAAWARRWGLRLSARAAAAPARGPPALSDSVRRDLAAAERYIKGIAGGMPLKDGQRAALFEQWLEEAGIDPGSERARAAKSALLPREAAADAAALEGVSPLLSRHHASLLKLAREQGTTPGGISAALVSAGVAAALASVDAAAFEHQAWLALRRASLRRAVRRYPRNAQGDFLRGVASDMAVPGGKSVEEVAREGVFAYVDFAGGSVAAAGSGRDPDASSPQMVFYVTRRREKWRFDGYRQNRALGRSDAQLARALKDWLTAGGIPAADLE